MKHLQLCILLSLAPLVAQAHHSFAIYDSSRQLTIEGTVKEFQWTNPHVWIHVMVKNDKGVEEQWNVECTSVNFLERRGWSRHTFKLGDKVSITLAPLRDGSKGGSFRKVNSINGVEPRFEAEE
ncbi:MAG: DUF6152 family protein [Pseudomonadota bacterium]